MCLGHARLRDNPFRIFNMILLASIITFLIGVIIGIIIGIIVTM